MENKKIRALILIIIFGLLGLYGIFFMPNNDTAVGFLLRFGCFFVVGWNLSILTSK